MSYISSEIQITESAASVFSTARIQKVQLGVEKRILSAMDRLHKVFANSTDETVKISEMSPEGFHCVQELLDDARLLVKHNIHKIPPASTAEDKRTLIANIAAHIG